MAGPRRTRTGFPCKPRLTGATFRLYSVFNVGLVNYAALSIDRSESQSPSGLARPFDEHYAFTA